MHDRLTALIGAIRCEPGGRKRPDEPDRGRDAHHWAPPAQIRTCRIPAYGSYLGCLTAKRSLGQGWRIRGFGSQSSANFPIRAHVTPNGCAR